MQSAPIMACNRPAKGDPYTTHGGEITWDTFLQYWPFVWRIHWSIRFTAWWCHDMKTLAYYWSFVRWIHQWIPLTKGMWRFDIFFGSSPGKLLSKQSNCWWSEMTWYSGWNRELLRETLLQSLGATEVVTVMGPKWDPCGPHIGPIIAQPQVDPIVIN